MDCGIGRVVAAGNSSLNVIGERTTKQCRRPSTLAQQEPRQRGLHVLAAFDGLQRIDRLIGNSAPNVGCRTVRAIRQA